MPLKPHPTDPDKMVYFKREYTLLKAWIDLTDDEMREIIRAHDVYLDMGRAIEAKLKEKNT